MMQVSWIISPKISALILPNYPQHTKRIQTQFIPKCSIPSAVWLNVDFFPMKFWAQMPWKLHRSSVGLHSILLSFHCFLSSCCAVALHGKSSCYCVGVACSLNPGCFNPNPQESFENCFVDDTNLGHPAVADWTTLVWISNSCNWSRRLLFGIVFCLSTPSPTPDAMIFLVGGFKSKLSMQSANLSKRERNHFLNSCNQNIASGWSIVFPNSSPIFWKSFVSIKLS